VCSCAVQAKPGGGIAVTGTGSGASPYLIGIDPVVAAEATNTVKVIPQTWNTAQRLQARTNISAVGKDDLVYDVRDHGAVGNGTTDDTAAINTAAAAAAAAGARLFATGTYKISSTVTLRCDADLSQATFNYSGTGVAVTVGGSGSYSIRKDVRLPKIINVAKTANGWAQTNVAGTTGLVVQNCYNVDVTVPHVQGFETGMKLYGTTSNGVSYCNVTLGHLDNNKRNLWFTSDATGWTNQNNFYGGRLSHNSNEGTVVAGTRHILMDTTASKVNNNNFWGTSIESPNTVEFHLDCGGNDNYWWGCRWENTGTGARVNWQANSIGNVIAHGFTSHTIVETRGANTSNHLLTRGRSRMVGDGAALGMAVLALENSFSSSSAALRVMEAGAESAGTNQTTGWAVELSAQKMRGKRAGDANDRLIVDCVNGRIYVGDATAAPTAFWFGQPTSMLLSASTSLYFATDNVADIGSTVSLRPRHVRAGTSVVAGSFVQTGAAVTGSRPSAATAGVGAMFYDTTLSKPIWSNGTVWKDSAGTTV
jgi:hypothetical protein